MYIKLSIGKSSSLMKINSFEEWFEISGMEEFKDVCMELINDEPNIWFTQDLEKLSIDNKYFRHVVKTSPYNQIVLMSLEEGQDIGMERHDVDQFIRIEKGNAEVIINGNKYFLEKESSININANDEHNVVNVGSEPLKLYTVYSPPHHSHGLIQIHKNK